MRKPIILMHRLLKNDNFRLANQHRCLMYGAE